MKHLYDIPVYAPSHQSPPNSPPPHIVGPTITPHPYHIPPHVLPLLHYHGPPPVLHVLPPFLVFPLLYILIFLIFKYQCLVGP